MSHNRLGILLCGLVLLSSGVIDARPAPTPTPAPKPPVIAAVRPSSAGTALLLVHVSKGTRRVTLQALEGAKNWITRAIAHTDGSGTDITFKVPTTIPRNRLRVTGSASDTFPTSFFKGKTSFTSVSSSTPSLPVGNSVLAGANSTSLVASGNTSTSSSGTVQPAVTEADIWKVSGNTLYFFNQYRGLQIIDITNPDSPVLKGTLNLPAVGEDMYVLDANHVILLARNGSQWDQTEAIAVTITNGSPSIANSLPINGWIVTSRMVGTALFVVSEGYQAGAYSEWGTQLSSFDFSDPANPIARNTLSIGGYNNVVTATDRFLFVAGATWTDWWHSQIQVIDITSPDGTMVLKGSIAAAGTVYDKFKMGLNGDVLSVISMVYNWPQQPSSKLETFSLADPTAPSKLGEIAISTGDWLYATRFDGNLAYVVTARNVDPLWIIDLSNPASPALAGSLEVSGHSTFLQPLNGQLVTMGVVNGQVAVSLFDVHDPTAPALLSQLAVGGGTYSWSEANFDEKAFSVLTDAGLILLPVNSYDPQTGDASGIQLVDLGSNSLTKRGIINANFGPRRATVFDNRILSISGRELLTVDPTNRDLPSVTSDVALAWPVNRVFVQGDYLIEIETGQSGWWTQSGPVLRVALASNPDTVLSEKELTGSPICGATVHGGKLYLAQADSQSGFFVLPLSNTVGGLQQSGTNNKATLTASTYDLSNLPQLGLLGSGTAQIDPLGWSPTLNALWPKPGVLVWAAAGQLQYPILYGGPVLVGSPLMAAIAPGVKTLAVRPLSTSVVTVHPQQSCNTTLQGATLTTISSSTVLQGGVITVGNVGATAGTITNATLSLGGSLTLEASPGNVGTTAVTVTQNTPILQGGVITVGNAGGIVNTITSNATASLGGSLTLGASVGSISLMPWWGGGSSGARLFAFDVSNAGPPTFLTETKLSSNAWNTGAVFSGTNVIFSSHAGSRQIQPLKWGWMKAINAPFYWGWEQGWYLDVIDYTTPATPVVRDPVSIPSQLVGISNASADGAILYGVGAHYDSTNSGTRYLDASAYDGISATLVDSVALSGWSNPLLVDGSNVIVAQASGSNNANGEIDTWTLGATGSFTRLGSLSLASLPLSMRAFGSLLAVSSGVNVQLIDKSNPTTLTLLGGNNGNAPYSLSIDFSDGDPTRGVWIPLGDYGVEFLGVSGN